MHCINRRATLGWAVTLMTGLVGSAGAAIPSAIVPDFQPTPTFTAAWQKARASFELCHSSSAVNRYTTIGVDGTRLGDPVSRYRFLADIAAANYYAAVLDGESGAAKHDKKTVALAKREMQAAKAYDRTALNLGGQLTLAQQDALSRQALAIGEIEANVYQHACSPIPQRPSAARSAEVVVRRIVVVPPVAGDASTAQTCHITATQGYSRVMGPVKATGLGCDAAKPVITSLDRALIKGFQGTFSRKVSGQSWRCSWERTSDSTAGYRRTAGTKKLAWTFGQP
jgi:hypothetical protein